MAREGRRVLMSTSHSWSCCARSARSWKRRPLKKLPVAQPTRFYGALLLGRPRPAEFGGEAIVERHLPEGRIPDDQIFLPGDHDGPGIVPDRHERHAAEGLERLQQSADERLFGLIRDQDDVGEPAPLQAAGEEPDPLDRAGGVADQDLAEVTMTELARPALQAHHRAGGYRTQAAEQLVERRLAAAEASFLGPPEQLHPGQRAILRQPLNEPWGPRGCDGRPAGGRAGGRRRHGPLLGRSPLPLPGEAFDRRPPVKSVSSEVPRTGQNFRKRRGQSFRNLHERDRRTTP